MLKRIAIATLLILAGLVASAQTINFNLGSKSCVWNGSYVCDGIPITNTDGSQPVPSNYTPAFVYSDLLYNGRLNGFYFQGNYGLGNGVNGGANVTSYTVTDLQTTPATSRVDVQVAGLMLDGVHTYAGTVSYVYSIGVRHCSGGRGGGCSTPWTIYGGTGTIQVMTPQTVQNLPTVSLGIKPLNTQGPYGYGTCNGVQIVAGPWYAGNGQTCAVYKGYCPVTQLGNQWQWVYWTDCVS